MKERKKERKKEKKSLAARDHEKIVRINLDKREKAND